MELAELQRNWEAFGAEDPLWAILTIPGKRFGQWNVDEFFQCGRDQIRGQMACIEERGIRLNRRRALDFGCGVGRLTQALGDDFQECDGIDISPSMIERAREFNRHGDRCRYHVNARNDLSLFADDTFDLVLTFIVLQHMQPKYILNYVQEFLRIIVPGGLALFQVPGGVDHNHVRPEPDRPRSANLAPLPDSAFRAKITSVERPSTLTAGSQVALIVRVQNLGDVPWRVVGTENNHRLGLSLGNHWFDEHGRLVTQDDGRTRLPWDLGPGEEIDLSLTVTVPSAPGRYLLELDMVQEQVAWFKQRGSEPIILPIEVKAASETVFTPQMQMYSVDKDEMISFIQARGGKVIDVERVNEGQGLYDYNYYVTK